MNDTSTDVLVERIDGFKALMEAQHTETTRRLEEIQAQTTKTNGRVSKLEKWQTAIFAGSAVLIFLLRDSLIQIIKSIF